MISKEKINTDDFWDNWSYPKNFTGNDIEEVNKAIKITIKKSLASQKEKFLKVIDKFAEERNWTNSIGHEELKQKIKNEY